MLYVLDEPSAGLHARDNERLVASLVRLRDQGNSLLVVEHDEALIRAADYLLDLGEGAGAHGGRVIAAGSLEQVMRTADSPTGRYLSGALPREPSQRRQRDKFLRLSGATLHNLKQVSVHFPIAALSCVSGVSGSGKSSLVVDTLIPCVKAALARRELPLPV
ncbi:MAG TPA: excinuclease ABC subunit UvrA, partial [Polyangiales bacterium]